MPPAAAEGKRPKGKHGVHVAASPGPDRFLFSDLPTREVKALIRAALPAGDPVKLVLAVTAKGRWRGWAKITAGDEARAAAVVAKLNGAVVKLTSGAEVSLRASRGLGRRDNVFPFLDRGLRESFALDSTAAYSAMDEHTTALLASFLACVYGSDPAALSVTDACACTGACAVVLARHFRAVNAVELDAGRCDALRANVGLCGADAVSVHHGDYNALWDTHTLRQDVVFLDVPWGGPDYVEAEGSACDALGDVPLVDVVLRLRRRASAVALRLPTKGPFDVDAFAAALVAASAWDDAEERCLPFRITTHLAHLVVVLMPGPRFGLRTLDATMAAARAWDERWRQDLRPAFYDWEAKRWIGASRWIPARARRSRPAEGAPAASDV